MLGEVNDCGMIGDMSVSSIDTAESSILSRVIAPQARTLPKAVAEEVLKWGFDEADRERMIALAAKAREGELDSEEIAETEAYERVSSFLGLVKSKARRSLQSYAGK